MSFSIAVAAAPEDADYVAYKNLGIWVVLMRRSDGIWDSIANVSSFGFDLILTGASGHRKALWNFETKQFETGSVEQLVRDDGQ
jgi:hypothetical protein